MNVYPSAGDAFTGAVDSWAAGWVPLLSWLIATPAKNAKTTSRQMATKFSCSLWLLHFCGLGRTWDSAGRKGT